MWILWFVSLPIGKQLRQASPVSACVYLRGFALLSTISVSNILKSPCFSYTCLLSLRAGLSASESLSLAFSGSVSDPGLSSFSSSPCVAVSPLCQPLGAPFLSPPCSLSHPFRTGLWAGGFPTLAPDPLTNLHLVFPLQAGDEPQCPYELWTPGPMLLGKVR